MPPKKNASQETSTALVSGKSLVDKDRLRKTINDTLSNMQDGSMYVSSDLAEQDFPILIDSSHENHKVKFKSLVSALIQKLADAAGENYSHLERKKLKRKIEEEITAEREFIRATIIQFHPNVPTEHVKDRPLVAPHISDKVENLQLQTEIVPDNEAPVTSGKKKNPSLVESVTVNETSPPLSLERNNPDAKAPTKGKKRSKDLALKVSHDENLGTLNQVQNGDKLKENDWETEIIKMIPIKMQEEFREICFAEWKNSHFFPVIQLGPSDAPSNLRDTFIKMVAKCHKGGREPTRLVYWYGNSHDNLQTAFSFIPSRNIISYENGCSKGYDKVPPNIQKKIDSETNLSANEKLKIEGLKELKEELEHPKEMRVHWIKTDTGSNKEEDDESLAANEECSLYNKNAGKGRKRKNEEKIDESPDEIKEEGRGRKRKSIKDNIKEPRTKNSRKEAASKQTELHDEFIDKKDETESVMKKRNKLKEEISRQVEAADILEEVISSEDDNDDDFSAQSKSSSSQDDHDYYVNEEKDKKGNHKKLSSPTKGKKEPVTREKMLSDSSVKQKNDNNDHRPMKEKNPKMIEQKRFNQCETIFLRDMEQLQIAIEAKNSSSCLRCLDNIHKNVVQIVPSFVHESNIGILIKNARYVFELINDDEVKPRAKALTSALKAQYNAKEKFADFKPKRSMQWPVKVQGIVDLSTKRQGSEPATALKIITPKTKESKPESESQGTVDKVNKLVQPPPKKILSLAKIFEPKAPNEIHTLSSAKPYTSQDIEALSEYPKWLTDETMDEKIYEDSIRELSMEFLKETLIAFKSERVNPNSIIYALEKAIFEYAEGNDMKYWDKIHDVVSAILGKRHYGTIVKRIEDGYYRTARSVVLIPGKYLFQSFENKEMTV